MQHVEFYKLQDDGTQSVIATCLLNSDGVVTCDNPAIMKDFIESGVVDWSDPEHKKRLYPKDGIMFLENLQYNFSSGYLNASEIKQ